jgi:hypothetical protein
MDPGDELSAVAAPAADSTTNKAEEHVEYPAAIRTHRHCRTEQHRAGVRQIEFAGSRLPGFRNIDAEPPGVGDVCFGPAKDAGTFIIGGVVPMGINGRCARLQPGAWRASALANGSADCSCRFDPRIEDRGTVATGVSTVDAAPRHIDHDTGPSISAAHAPTVSPSQEITFHAAGSGRRLRTTTSCPSPRNARARIVPTCPDPPGMTTLMSQVSDRRHGTGTVNRRGGQQPPGRQPPRDHSPGVGRQRALISDISLSMARSSWLVSWMSR